MNTNTNNVNTETFTFPDGEFKIKDLQLLFNKKQPFIHAQVKSAIASQKIKFVRNEKAAGRGRPSAVYSKI